MSVCIHLWRFGRMTVFLAALDSQGDGTQARTKQGIHRIPGNLSPDIDTSWTSSASPSRKMSEASPTSTFKANVFAEINHMNGAARPITHQRSRLIMDQGAVPKAQLWNDSDHQITAAVITVDLGIHSDNIQKVEGVVYHDAYIDARHRAPIEGKGNMQITIPYVKGPRAQNLAPNVRAVLYSDGSAEGEQEWVDMLMKRRGRLYQRLLSIRNLLAAQVDVVSVSQIIQDLRSAQNELRQRLGPDELGDIDDIAFESAIGTLGANSKQGANPSMRWYIEVLDRRIAQLAPWATAAPSETGANLRPDSSPQHARTERHAVSGQSLEHNGLHSLKLASLSRLGPRETLFDTYTCNFSGRTQSVVLSDGCGPNNYYSFAVDLVQHDLTTNTSSNVTVNLGPDWAYGACYAGYTDCNGNSVDANSRAGGAGNGLVISPEGNDEYFWFLDDYHVDISSCSCNDPNPNGVTQNFINDPYETNHVVVITDVACP